MPCGAPAASTVVTTDTDVGTSPKPAGTGGPSRGLGRPPAPGLPGHPRGVAARQLGRPPEVALGGVGGAGLSKRDAAVEEHVGIIAADLQRARERFDRAGQIAAL